MSLLAVLCVLVIGCQKDEPNRPIVLSAPPQQEREPKPYRIEHTRPTTVYRVRWTDATGSHTKEFREDPYVRYLEWHYPCDSAIEFAKQKTKETGRDVPVYKWQEPLVAMPKSTEPSHD
jgi:hypothetical protein